MNRHAAAVEVVWPTPDRFLAAMKEAWTGWGDIRDGRLLTVTIDGEWVYSTDDGIYAGQVPDEVFADLVAATSSTTIDAAPLRGSLPPEAEFTHPEFVYTWRDAEGSLRSASVVERRIRVDDPLVDALSIVLDEWGYGVEPEDAQRARGTAVVARGLVGRSEAEAESLLGALAPSGLVGRVVERDGLPVPGADDESPTRVDLTIKDGYVSAATAG